MTKESAVEHMEKLYEQLSEAYDRAGHMRDVFTGCGEYEHNLKEVCNSIRGKIYELQRQKNLAMQMVKLSKFDKR